MVLGLIILLSELLLPVHTQPTSLYAYTKKRADKVLNKYWPGDEFTLTRKAVPLAKPIEIYEIKQGNSTPFAYVLFDEAPSKVDTFIYLVIFDSHGVIEKVAVLLYKENYGGEIASKRFLSQFVGKANGQSMQYTKDIDGISGATLSARSITLAIRKNSMIFSELIKKF